MRVREIMKRVQETQVWRKMMKTKIVGARRSHLVAPRPSFVCLMIAVSGWSSPPVNPMEPPSDQPIMANMRNPTLSCVILGAAYIGTISMRVCQEMRNRTLPTSSPSR